MGHLSLSFLGGFEVTLEAEPATAFGAEKARALLAFLAIESSRPHLRAELSAMFWPDLSEKKAAHNLSQNLLRLRQALREKEDPARPSFLVVTPQGVQFNSYSDCQLDVARFRELLNRCHQHHHPEAASCGVCHQWLGQAADLYRGNLLAGLFVPDSVAFEEWRLVQQEELHRQALETLRRLAAYYERRGNFEQVQEYARRQIALEPWHEEAHLQLMRALAQSGGTSAALRQYETYQRTLAEEFGIKPAAEVTAFYEQIRSGEPAQQVAAQPGAGEAAWLSSQGERRQVTVLVCGRGIQGDPEALQGQLSVCERHCEGIFNRFGGRRAVRQGAACLVYFGYPQAYEDAARRAVHSGLAVAAALEENAPVRIGIHTGVMTVGEKRGRRWQDRDLIGKAPETARDCLRLAGPGEVIITEETGRLVQDSFDLQPMGTQVLETPGQSLEVYQVGGERGAQSRLDWLAQTQRLTALTGRQEELARLRTWHEKVLQGKGHVVFLRGEPGIGKSRLIWELEKSVSIVGASTAGGQNELPPVLWLASRCLPHYQNTSLYPMIGLLEGLLGFEAEDGVEVRQQKLSGMLARHQLNRPSALWLLSLLLGLPTEASPPETITQAQREQMRELFIALLQKRAAEQPLALVIEDLHWSDPSTVEWLGQSLNSLAAAPCLTLLTARPGFHPAWLSHQDLPPNLLLLSLSPLPPEQAEGMVTDLAGERMLDEAVRRHIVAQADGIPLFVEELTKTLIERPASKADGKGTTEIPATLLDSLAARLDHLGRAKETAQWAAVLGREFSYPILQACAPYEEGRLQSDLARLIEAELVSPVHTGPGEVTPSRSRAPKVRAPARYAFKHTLVQEAAYASMLKGTRQVYHRRIAEILETRFPQVAETRPEVLAQHYSNAGLQTQAVDFWLRAGERATAQGATLEARIFFDRAVESVEPGDRERRWQALWGREEVLDLRGERSAQEADLAALLDLAEAFDDDTRRAQVYLRQSAYAAMLGNYRGTLPPAEAASVAARRADNLSLELRALAYKAQTLMFFGEMATVQSVVEETLAQAPLIEDESTRALVLTIAAQYYLESGDLVRSVQHQRQGAEAARRAGNYILELTINANLGLLYATLGLFSEARSLLEAELPRAEMLGDQRLHASALRHLGYVYWWSGERDVAQQILKQALNELTRTGDAYGEAACSAYLGYILEAANDLTSAAEYLAKARARFGEVGADSDKFEAQAVESRVALAQGRREAARQLVTEVCSYLREHGTEGLSSPSWIYVCVADVLEAVETPNISPREVVETGYRELMQRAEKISDPDWHRSFLENVAENKALVERREKLDKVDSPF